MKTLGNMAAGILTAQNLQYSSLSRAKQRHEGGLFTQFLPECPDSRRRRGGETTKITENMVWGVLTARNLKTFPPIKKNSSICFRILSEQGSEGSGGQDLIQKLKMMAANVPTTRTLVKFFTQSSITL